jgi:hypothetical protein
MQRYGCQKGLLLTSMKALELMPLMTEPSPEPPKKGFKVTLVQGIIGAASLAGTTAIPLVVQRLIGAPAPVNSPTPAPSQVSSPSPQVQPTLSETSETELSATEDDANHREKGKGKKKGKKDD